MVKNIDEDELSFGFIQLIRFAVHRLISMQAWYHDGDDDDDDDDDVEWCEVVWAAQSKDQFRKNPRLSVWVWIEL